MNSSSGSVRAKKSKKSKKSKKDKASKKDQPEATPTIVHLMVGRLGSTDDGAAADLKPDAFRGVVVADARKKFVLVNLTASGKLFGSTFTPDFVRGKLHDEEETDDEVKHYALYVDVDGSGGDLTKITSFGDEWRSYLLLLDDKRMSDDKAATPTVYCVRVLAAATAAQPDVSKLTKTTVSSTAAVAAVAAVTAAVGTHRKTAKTKSTSSTTSKSSGRSSGGATKGSEAKRQSTLQEQMCKFNRKLTERYAGLFTLQTTSGFVFNPNMFPDKSYLYTQFHMSAYKQDGLTHEVAREIEHSKASVFRGTIIEEDGEEEEEEEEAEGGDIPKTVKFDNNLYTISIPESPSSRGVARMYVGVKVHLNGVPAVGQQVGERVRVNDVMYPGVPDMLGYAVFTLTPTNTDLRAVTVVSKQIPVEAHVMVATRKDNRFHVACSKSKCRGRIKVLMFGEGKNADVRTHTFKNVNVLPFIKHQQMHDKEKEKKGGKSKLKKPEVKPGSIMASFLENARLANIAVGAVKGKHASSSSSSSSNSSKKQRVCTDKRDGGSSSGSGSSSSSSAGSSTGKRRRSGSDDAEDDSD